MLMTFDCSLILERGDKLTDLNLFCCEKCLSVNIDKTKVMVFNTMEAWVTILEPKFFLEKEKVHTHAPTHT